MKRTLIVSSLVCLLLSLGFGLWLYNSRARSRCDDFYIPAGTITQRKSLAERVPDYYSAMQEAPFSCLNSRIEAYRFLVMPSFDSPASIRVWREGNHSFVAIKQLTEPATPEHPIGKDLKVNETRPLNDAEWTRFKGLVTQASFWTLAAEVDDLQLDGTVFVLEGHDGRNYHVIVRGQNPNKALMNVTDFFFDLARLKWRQ